MVRLPSALPLIFAGLDIGIVFSILGAVVGEFDRREGGPGIPLVADQLQLRHRRDVRRAGGALRTGPIAHFIIRFAQKRLVFWLEENRVIGA